MSTVRAVRDWTLFLDDERMPPDSMTAKPGVMIARAMDWAQTAVHMYGVPKFISFDHDLGDNQPTGYDFVRWLADHIMDHDIPYEEFDWYVHSQNPVGAENINRFLTNFLPVWKSGSWKT